ncbi:UNVERIFIED_CONTAM: hypothetical protein Slati_1941000 [Sesamum latifolium]|uniref:Uncharacterized protein n=1 Tax=Sesamum latifolium TaxID=2727402 RepID=A0AAW2X3I3_9LAMI
MADNQSNWLLITYSNTGYNRHEENWVERGVDGGLMNQNCTLSELKIDEEGGWSEKSHGIDGSPISVLVARDRDRQKKVTKSVKIKVCVAA